MASLDSNRRRVVKAMKAAGIYSPQLTIQIDALAAQLTLMQRAALDAETLDSIYVKVLGKGGDVININAHPVSKILKDTSDAVTRMCKQLNLTVADIVGKPDRPTPLDALRKEIESIE